MQFTLNRRSTVPMYRQLAAELREQIVSGAMAEGYRLPPERELASRLEVNRTTVLQAYQQLKDEGLIASKVGKGTFVLPLQHIETARIPVVRHEPIDEEPKPSVVRPPWSVLFSDYSNRFTYHDIASAERAQRGDTIIDFATGSPNPADIPDDLLRSVSIEAFESREFDGQPESPIEGFDELRALLAEHMSTRGVQCDVRNVMVLSGSEQGIDLIVRAFVNPGDCVLVEQSTFFPALQTFRSADARIIGVPVDEHGMRRPVGWVLRAIPAQAHLHRPDVPKPHRYHAAARTTQRTHRRGAALSVSDRGRRCLRRFVVRRGIVRRASPHSS